MARSSSRFVETEWCFSWKWKESLLEFRKRPRVFSVGNSAKVISNCGLLRLSGEILDSTERDDESHFVRLKPPSFSRAVRFFWRWMASALESIDVGDIDWIQLRNPSVVLKSVTVSKSAKIFYVYRKMTAIKCRIELINSGRPKRLN